MSTSIEEAAMKGLPAAVAVVGRDARCAGSVGARAGEAVVENIAATIDIGAHCLHPLFKHALAHVGLLPTCWVVVDPIPNKLAFRMGKTFRATLAPQRAVERKLHLVDQVARKGAGDVPNVPAASSNLPKRFVSPRRKTRPPVSRPCTFRPLRWHMVRNKTPCNSSKMITPIACNTRPGARQCLPQS